MRGRVLATCHAAGVLAGMGAAMLGPILPVLAKSWGLADSQTGGLLSCEFFGGFCGAIASGWLGPKLAPSRLLQLGLLLLTLGLLGAGKLPALWMAPALFVCGLALGFINPIANVLVAEASANPAAGLNLFGFSWAAGALGAPFAIGMLLRQQTPGRVFVELAVVSALVYFGSLAIRTAGRHPAEPARRATTGRAPAAFIAISALILFLYVGIETSVSIWLPTSAERWAASSPEAAAALQSTFWAALLAGRLAAPLWLRLATPRTLIAAGLVIAAIGIAALLCGLGYSVMLSGALLSGFALAPVNPTVVALFTTRLGDSASRWTGPVFASSALGGAGIPWLVGVLSTRSGSLRLGFSVLPAGIAGMLLLRVLQQRIDTPRISP